MKVECGDCGRISDETEIVRVFPNIPDLAERIAPGEPVPFGECPDCGALVHEIKATFICRLCGEVVKADDLRAHLIEQKRMITQLRSAGVGMIIGAQSVSAIDPAVTANVGSFMCLRAQTDADVRISGRLLELPDDRLDDVRHIPRWSGLFRSPSHSGAVLVDVPEVDMGDYLSDAELAALNKPSLDRLAAQTVLAPLRSDAGAPIFYRDILGETLPAGESAKHEDAPFDVRDEHRIFVRDILAHPDASVVEHYANVGWSSGRGTRVKSALLDNGIVESKRQTSRNGRPVERLVVTDKGKALFNDIEA